MDLFISKSFSFLQLPMCYPSLLQNLEYEVFVHSLMTLLDSFIFGKLKSLGEILGYSAITDYVLTCRFSGSIPV